MTAPGKATRLSDEDWNRAQRQLPIACVDVLPVVRSEQGPILMVGLILRESPMGEVWCHIGGRINRGERMSVAAVRHLEDSLKGADVLVLHPDPYCVNEFFTDRRPDAGYDPRKHAVAACYIAESHSWAAPNLEHQGDEALDFQWFTPDSLPDAERLWPGTDIMIERALEHFSHERNVELDMVSYQAISTRHAMHNQLMWQSPVLALTAMAFLLTIALSQQADWMRVVAALLSTLVALISAQLFARHSESELEDARRLERIEIRRGLVHVHKKRPYGSIKLGQGFQSWLADHRSRAWWWWALLLFAAASFAISVQAVVAWCI